MLYKLGLGSHIVIWGKQTNELQTIYKRGYQPTLRFPYTETLKRRDEISSHFKEAPYSCMKFLTFM